MRKILFSLLMIMAGSASAAEHEVQMLNQGEEGIMVFEPAYLKVEPGDTISFKAVDLGHDSSSFFGPEGGATWQGDNSKDVSVALDTNGLYLYKCTPHVSMAMVGVIQVGEATNKEQAVESARELAKQFALNKDRFDKYLAQVQ